MQLYNFAFLSNIIFWSGHITPSPGAPKVGFFKKPRNIGIKIFGQALVFWEKKIVITIHHCKKNRYTYHWLNHLLLQLQGRYSVWSFRVFNFWRGRKVFGSKHTNRFPDMSKRNYTSIFFCTFTNFVVRVSSRVWNFWRGRKVFGSKHTLDSQTCSFVHLQIS